MVFCPEHPKGDQNLKFTPLSEMMSIPAPFHVGKPHPTPPPPHPPAFLTISANQIGSSDQSEACRAKNILFE